MIEKKMKAKDQIPKLIEIETVLAVLLIVSYPFVNCNILFILLSVMSVIRKSGQPELSQEYLNRVMFTEELTNLTYNLCILMAYKNVFINLPIIITCVLLLGKGYIHFTSIFPCIPGRLDGIQARGYFTKLISPSFRSELTQF